MPKILIIEDNLMHLNMVGDILTRSNYEVITAENSLIGLKLAQETLPDLILMDMDLPGIDGFKSTSILKNNSKTSNIPVVALTALVADEYKKKAFKSGCDGFISKPINIHNFISTIENYIEPQPKKATVKVATEPKKSEKIQYKPHEILIVDDNLMNTELLKATLTQINQNVKIAYNGFEALNLIENNHFDLILLDIMMPEMSGFELIGKIKENPTKMNIPVIFISALNEPHHIVKGLDLGSYDYITKPFNIDELKARVLSILRIKDLQDELKQKNENLDKIYKFSTDGIIFLDKEFNIKSCSDQVLRWFKKNERECIQTNLSKFLGCKDHEKPEDCPVIREIVQSCEEQNNAFRIKDPLFNRHFEIGCSKILNKNGDIDGYILVIRDDSTRRELEDQKETFIATLTHDLKTPIRAEITALDLLLKNRFGALKDEQVQIVNEILNSSKFMLNMVDTILSKYKYENGSVVLNKDLFDLNLLITNCYEELKYIINDKKLKVVLNFSSPTIFINADMMEIKRLITNLFSNAVSYTLENGSIEIATELKDDKVIASFKDNGHGIASEDLDGLFEKYVSYAKKFRQIGTGLGLYVAKQIVSNHNGKIWVNSTEGEGSTFSFEIPLNDKSIVCDKENDAKPAPAFI